MVAETNCTTRAAWENYWYGTERWECSDPAAVRAAYKTESTIPHMFGWWGVMLGDKLGAIPTPDANVPPSPVPQGKQSPEHPSTANANANVPPSPVLQGKQSPEHPSTANADANVSPSPVPQGKQSPEHPSTAKSDASVPPAPVPAAEKEPSTGPSEAPSGGMAEVASKLLDPQVVDGALSAILHSAITYALFNTERGKRVVGGEQNATTAKVLTLMGSAGSVALVRSLVSGSTWSEAAMSAAWNGKAIVGFELVCSAAQVGKAGLEKLVGRVPSISGKWTFMNWTKGVMAVKPS